MAEDGDVGINARMTYSLEDLEESSTFIIQTDPETQEGVILLAKVNLYILSFSAVCECQAMGEHLWHPFGCPYSISSSHLNIQVPK